MNNHGPFNFLYLCPLGLPVKLNFNAETFFSVPFDRLIFSLHFEMVVSIVNRLKWLGRPVIIKEANKQAMISFDIFCSMLIYYA